MSGRGWVRQPKQPRPEPKRTCKGCAHSDNIGRCWAHQRTQWVHPRDPACELFEGHDEEAEYWRNNWDNH